MIRWQYRKLPTGDYEGMITFVPQQAVTLPGFPGAIKAGKPIKLRATGTSKAQALSKAARVAKAIADNPLMAAVLPPGTGAALTAVSYLSKSAAAGKLKSAAKRIGGKGAKRLYKALKKFW